MMIWAAIALCLSQSAMLSGLNLACFTINKLELQIEVAKGNRNARRVLALRENANFLLVTILWGNVAVNVLLALLSGSVLAGVWAFVFSTVVITLFGEIFPQASFTRHALRFASLFAPVLRFYQIVLYPVAKPTALLLDRWLGPEAIVYLKERDLRTLIRLHMAAGHTDIASMEGQGALNFLELDDIPLADEGEPLDPASIVQLPLHNRQPVFPAITGETGDAFLRQLHASGKKWIVVVDPNNAPHCVIDADEFIRDALFNPSQFIPHHHCQRPVIVTDGRTTLGEIIPEFHVVPAHSHDDVVDRDVIVLWTTAPRIITGADVLGRLLRGIVRNPVDTWPHSRRDDDEQ